MIRCRLCFSVAGRHTRVMLLMLLGLLMLFRASPAHGQGGTELLEGIPVVGTLGPEAPAAIYTFIGTPGALLIVHAVGLSDGMSPDLSLLSTTQQPLASSDTDPFGLGNDARLSHVMDDSGPYFVLVGGTAGSFVIRYSVIPQDAATLLAPGSPVTDDFVGGSPRVYAFSADAVQPMNLAVTTPTGSTSLPFVAHVYTAEGQPVGALHGQTVNPAALLIPPGIGNYLVVVSALGPESSGPLTITVTRGIPASAPGLPTAATPVLGSGTGNQCLATALRSDIAVNLRGGPGTSYAVVGSIPVGGAFTITARDASGTWYGGRLPSGQIAWVFSGVVSLTGPCQQLQVLGTLAPTATYTVTPTITGTQSVTPTATYTPTASGTAPTWTPTYTPTASPTTDEQTAPPDSDLNGPLTIPLDSSAWVTDYVSYPNGDRDDRVQYEVTGMSTDPDASGGRAHLLIQATCTGTGTDQVQFYVAGITYGCGQPIVDEEVTWESRAGLIVITAVGGEGTYVEWTLTGTATRIE